MANNFGRVNVSITASTGGLTAGLSKAGRQLKGFQKGVGGLSALSGTLGGMGSMLLPVVGGITSVAAAIGALSSATKSAEALHNLSQELGVASGDLQVLQHVAEESGVSQELLTTGLRRTARMVGELAKGSKPAEKAFSRLGLTMGDMAGRSTTQQFALIAERISALPQHMQAAAAINIFGRSGQGMLNFLRQGGDAFREMDRLLTRLGVKMSTEQVAAIESMGDAVGRLKLMMQGFINQFLAGIAPAIQTVSNLIVNFFSENQSGWSLANAMADAFTSALRHISAAVTYLLGEFQVLASFVASFFSAMMGSFSGVTQGIADTIETMATAAEMLPGFDVGLASTLRSASGIVAGLVDQNEAEIWGQTAADLFTQGVQNMENPYAAFDQEFAAVQQSAQESMKNSLSAAAAAASKELNALVVGSSGGESYRNMLARGGDPRLSGADAAKQTADNTERAADGIEDVASAVRDIPGFGQAQVAMV